MPSQVPPRKPRRIILARPFSTAASLLLLVAIVAAAGLWLQASAEPAEPSPARNLTFTANVAGPSANQRSVSVEVFVPRGASARESLTVLVALHGMGGNGAAFSRPLLEAADRYGWVVVAPTFLYDNHLDVKQLTDDDLKALAALRTIIKQVAAETSLPLRERVLLYGFSRGAQLAHRFALFYPNEALGVASLSGGTYTLPATLSPDSTDGRPLDYPLGVADITTYTDHDFQPELVRQIHFFVGVGTRDNQERDVPREWDGCSGTTRVTRATAFAEALDAFGAPVKLVQFPNAVHQETPEMRREALDFLAAASK